MFFRNITPIVETQKLFKVVRFYLLMLPSSFPVATSSKLLDVTLYCKAAVISIMPHAGTNHPLIGCKAFSLGHSRYVGYC